MREISINQDGRWAGSGMLSDAGQIECTAILGPNDLDHESGEQQDYAERVYEAIEAAVARGETELEMDGTRYEWTIEGVSLRELTAEIREHERTLAPGSETGLWGSYCEDMRRITGVLPYHDDEGERYVTVSQAEYWRREYADQLEPGVEVVGLGDSAWGQDEWARYGTVRVRIGSVTYDVGVTLGVPESLRGTAAAAGGDTITPYLSAWYRVASDWDSAPGDDGSEGVPDHLTDEVLDAIESAARRLWDEAQETEVGA